MLFFVFVKQNTLQLEAFERPITHELNTEEAIRNEKKLQIFPWGSGFTAAKK